MNLMIHSPFHISSPTIEISKEIKILKDIAIRNSGNRNLLENIMWNIKFRLKINEISIFGNKNSKFVYSLFVHIHHYTNKETLDFKIAFKATPKCYKIQRQC